MEPCRVESSSVECRDEGFRRPQLFLRPSKEKFRVGGRNSRSLSHAHRNVQMQRIEVACSIGLAWRADIGRSPWTTPDRDVIRDEWRQSTHASASDMPRALLHTAVSPALIHLQSPRYPPQRLYKHLSISSITSSNNMPNSYIVYYLFNLIFSLEMALINTDYPEEGRLRGRRQGVRCPLYNSRIAKLIVPTVSRRKCRSRVHPHQGLQVRTP